MIFFLISSKIIYTLGTIRRVKSVEDVRPPITVIARGLHRLEPSSLLMAMGKSPRIVEIVVMKIGLNLSLDARRRHL